MTQFLRAGAEDSNPKENHMSPQKQPHAKGPHATQEIKQDFKAFQHDVRALRDEVKLKLHLANMDLKDEWAKLEPQLDHAINSAALVSSEVVADLKKRLSEFKQRLSKGN